MSLEAKLAWIFLHLRIASLGFGTTINTFQRGEELKIGMSVSKVEEILDITDVVYMLILV